MQPGNVLYNSNALCGEIGEVANLVKKIEMVKMHPEWVGDDAPSTSDLKIAISDELGDALFYLTRLTLDNGYTLRELMSYQRNKLTKQGNKYNRLFLK